MDKEETDFRKGISNEIFDDIFEVRMDRYTHAFNIRDYIVLWRGLDNLIFDLVDRPEFIHKMMERLTAISLDILEQLEEKGLLGQLQSTIHCFGAWTDELPQDSYNPHPKANDLWTYGMAQIFSNVSPQMHNEFEIEYAMRWYGNFGLAYYGCCEPLDTKMDIVCKLPNIRKVSMSPWTNMDRGAEAIGSDYVF